MNPVEFGHLAADGASFERQRRDAATQTMRDWWEGEGARVPLNPCFLLPPTPRKVRSRLPAALLSGGSSRKLRS